MLTPIIMPPECPHEQASIATRSVLKIGEIQKFLINEVLFYFLMYAQDVNVFFLHILLELTSSKGLPKAPSIPS